MKGFYYIENSVSEYRSDITAYFETLEEAKEAMKNCSDWYCDKGTGIIYFQPWGIERDTKRTFVMRGRGLTKTGNVIWSYKYYSGDIASVEVLRWR